MVHCRVQVVDVGTGGGFPGLPLAIACPHASFTLVDSIGKKLRCVEDMASRLGVTNVSFYHGRAENMRGEVSDPGRCMVVRGQSSCIR